MYQFTNTDQRNNDVTQLSAESLFINGSALENDIAGLTVLTTNGRELNTVKLSTQNVDEFDGVLFLGSQEEKRDITITCELIAKTNQEFRKLFEKLNLILRQGELKLTFNDDLNYYYLSYYTGYSNIPEGTNKVKFDIKFMCPTPFKYAKTVNKEGLTITGDYQYQNVPETITFNVTDTMQEVKLTNNRTGHFIKVVPEKQINGKIVVHPQRNTAFYGVLEKPQLISWDSDCEFFDVRKGDELTVTPNTTIEMEVRDKQL